MITLTYGYKKPINPDTGDIVFPALEGDIQQLNDHNHDGANSAPLATQTVSALAANWVTGVAGVSYKQLITVPTGLSFDTCNTWVKRSTGEMAYPTIERVSATTFYLYTNDNTLAYTLFFR